ncbi:hypothetical protein LEP1GSC059_2519 [Leptospira noguchii serovar Panama str. CZ214]|uniref:Uncharacterized protein n=1 Tax=Leptospira noguchii serovar Panama str. CZ214 TaxID=1001595 RepID=T0FTK9_9LEPT|nr:hypothetical protein LEP1GSC059_2519 [Leptospira noguchii serovar Panama str. CZ214]
MMFLIHRIDLEISKNKRLFLSNLVCCRKNSIFKMSWRKNMKKNFLKV